MQYDLLMAMLRNTKVENNTVYPVRHIYNTIVHQISEHLKTDAMSIIDTIIYEYFNHQAYFKFPDATINNPITYHWDNSLKEYTKQLTNEITRH